MPAKNKKSMYEKDLGLNQYLQTRGQLIVITLLIVIAIAVIAPNLPEQAVYSFVIPLATGIVVLMAGSVIIGYFNKVYGQRRVFKSSKPTYASATNLTTRQPDIALISYEEKKLFLDIPNVDFDYADRNKISNFYNSYFKKEKFRIEQVVSENISEYGGETKGQIPSVLESKISDKDQNKLTSTLKPYELSAEEMFLNYQRETVQKGQVTLGLEKVDIDLSDLNSFDNLIGELKTRFNFEADKTQVENTRIFLRKRAAERTILRLETSNGYVLMQGKFKISGSDNLYKLTYDHPVNEYVAVEGNRISISLFVNKDAIEPSAAGNYAQAIGSTITIKVYGSIWKNVARKEDSWELQITPLAIYR